MVETTVRDRYEESAEARLWALLPEVYRTADSLLLDAPGPMRELIARLAIQVAGVRRSLDRLWEDQSVESCDDWVLPYIATLVDTNLVTAMSPRGRRLDVANTINYRRRKGTLGLIEQLSADVTGWECRAVEFIRRLSRRRHGLDPEFGWPADSDDPAGARRLQREQRLVGELTRTPAGGWADLRHVAGAAATSTAFDEFHHRLDVRRAEGALGWYGISKLGLFLWRIQSLFVDRATPVPVAGCPGHFSFDPTGRQIALFQADGRGEDAYGERWRPLEAFQVPGPLSQAVWDAIVDAHRAPPPAGAWPDPIASLWPDSLSVSPVGAAVPLAETAVEVWPEVGRFAVRAGPPQVEVGYHYGLYSRIGAGPFDRREIGRPLAIDPAPVTRVIGGSAIALRSALAALGPTGTVIVTDGLTSPAVDAVGSTGSPIADVAVRAADGERAVIRLAATDDPWTFQGSTAAGSADANLRLEGLLVSGQDVVLRGGFRDVEITCCTLDPGTRGDLRKPPVTWDPAVDGRPLTPTRIWIEGTVRRLRIDRSIVGPIRVRLGGVVELVEVEDSIVQGLPVADAPAFAAGQLFDPEGFVRLLRDQPDPLTTWLRTQLSAGVATAVAAHADGTPPTSAQLTALVGDLNTLVSGASIWSATRFARRDIAPETVVLAGTNPTGADLARLNHRLLAEALPIELADAAIALSTGTLTLDRVTVLGAVFAHRLECSELILDDIARIEDPQAGCVRFSAWSTGSALPRRYESVEVAPRAPLFATRRFGEWGYALLSDGADAAIRSSTVAGTPSIRAGSHDGSEMGAFCRELTAIRERSLDIKLEEFLPVGLAAVRIPMPPFDAQLEAMRGTPWPPM